MSFSSRVIAETPPPVSPQVRAMGTLLWLLPPLMSVFILIASPWNGTVRRNPAHPERGASPLARIVEPPTLGEPSSFARARLLALPHSEISAAVDRLGFPMLAEAWPVSQTTKADPRAPLAAGSKPTHGGTPTNPSVSQTHEGRERFAIARAAGATTLEVDGARIALQDVEPLQADAICKRIDGATQPCAERALHRLSILLQGRDVTCHMSGDKLPSGERLGRCIAGQIDLGADLLRQKLVQRRVTRLARGF